MRYNKYKFRRYNKSYPKLFNNEKSKFKKILPKNVIIEHVGSTSIPGLGGKGIIDMVIFCKSKDINKIINLLIKNKYEIDSTSKNKKRIFFCRRIIYQGKERRIHIHLTSNKKKLNSFISFRDYLINNKSVKKEYEGIKKQASKASKGNKEIYNKYKKEFIRKTTKSALKN